VDFFAFIFRNLSPKCSFAQGWGTLPNLRQRLVKKYLPSLTFDFSGTHLIAGRNLKREVVFLTASYLSAALCLLPFKATCAAASLAIGTRKGEQLT
jgi:hypothetical protein